MARNTQKANEETKQTATNAPKTTTSDTPKVKKEEDKRTPHEVNEEETNTSVAGTGKDEEDHGLYGIYVDGALMKEFEGSEKDKAEREAELLWGNHETGYEIKSIKR